MAESKPVAQGKGPTNTTPMSKIPVLGALPVTIRIRLFPANATAALERNHIEKSKSLSGLPLIIGKVIGGKFEPFQDTIRRVPSPKNTLGKLDAGLFVEQSVEEKTALAKAKALAVDQKLDQAAHAKAQEAYKKLEAQWHQVAQHHMPLNTLVEAGTAVGICINIDAKKKFRQHPLWQVTVGTKDVEIHIFETFGKHGLDDGLKMVTTKNLGTDKTPKLVDYYTARLTGDIWKRSTHPFTAADIDAMPKDRATDAMRTALKKIYVADFTMEGKDFAIDVPRGKDGQDKASVRLHWLASENGNCLANIQSIDIKKDVPSRIHPEAYAAAANAAYESGLTEIRFSSSWRPMLGSIAHRAGLGLDVVWLKESGDATRMNRAALGKSEGTNVSKDEEKAFNEMKKAEQEAAAAKQKEKAAIAEEKTAKVAYAKMAKNSKASPEMIAEVKKKAEEATKAKDAAIDARKDAETLDRKRRQEWKKQVDKDQPTSVANFRSNIMKKPIVKQVLDPWYMDKDTHDNIEPTANDQSDGLEKQHNNHMHITINDPELGIGQ